MAYWRTWRGLQAAWIGLIVAFTAGCGGKDTSADKTTTQSGGGGTTRTASTTTSSAKRGKPWDPSLGTAMIRGVVNFRGDPPARREIDMSGVAECAKQHPQSARERSVLVNPNGTLRNVFVWVKDGLGDWHFPVPTEPAMIDQKGCRYEPHVLGVQVGQPVKIRNSDPVQHNIHALPKKQRGFNFAQPRQGMESIKKFRRAEVMVRLKCDVHGWMGAYIGVVDHPYFAVTGDEGAFAIKNLPPGEYTIGAKHEKYGTQTTRVVIGDKETKELEFILSAK